MAGCCCYRRRFDFLAGSIMSGFFWSSWSKLVRAHRAPPPQLRYTTSHSSPGRIRDCLWTRRDLTPNRRRVEPPPRRFNSHSGTGARSLVRAPSSPCAVSDARHLGFLPFPPLDLMETVDDAYCTGRIVIDPATSRGEQSIFGGDQSFFLHTRKD